MRMRAVLILDPIGQSVEWETRLKWDTTNFIALVYVSETEVLRGVPARFCSITWCLLFPNWDRCPKDGHSPNVIFSFCFAVFLSSLYTYKVAQSYKKIAGRDCP